MAGRAPRSTRSPRARRRHELSDRGRLLAWLWPGAGHLHIGKVKRGLVVMASALFLIVPPLVADNALEGRIVKSDPVFEDLTDDARPHRDDSAVPPLLREIEERQRTAKWGVTSFLALVFFLVFHILQVKDAESSARGVREQSLRWEHDLLAYALVLIAGMALVLSWPSALLRVDPSGVLVSLWPLLLVILALACYRTRR